MSTPTQFRPKRARRLAPNGRVFRKLAGNMPHFMLMEDGSISPLTHEERAFLRFTRSIPDDLRAECCAALQLAGNECTSAMSAFLAHCEERRSEIAWPPVESA